MLKVRLQSNEHRGDIFINPEDTLNTVLRENNITPNMTVYIDGVPMTNADLLRTVSDLNITEGAIISAIVKQDCAILL